MYCTEKETTVNTRYHGAINQARLDTGAHSVAEGSTVDWELSPLLLRSVAGQNGRQSTRWVLSARCSRMSSGSKCTLRLSVKSREQAIYLEGKFDMRYTNSQAILMKKRLNRSHPKRYFPDRSISLDVHLPKYLSLIDSPHEKRWLTKNIEDICI